MLQHIAVCGEKFLQIAKIISFFKTDGGLKLSSSVFSFSELSDLIKNTEDLFIYNENIFPKRVFVEDINVLPNFLLVKFKDFNSRESLEEYINSSLIVKNDYCQNFINSTNHILRILNFKVYNANNLLLGVISDFEISKQNKIILDNKIIIPFVDNFIISIDYDNRKIIMDLPLGLI